MMVRCLLLKPIKMLSLFYALSVLPVVTSNIPPTCESQIYCQGDLLHQVQLAGLYKDSKTFVDKSLVYDEQTIIARFSELKSRFADGIIPKDQLQIFVDTYFLKSDLLENWVPTDWIPNPMILNEIVDLGFKKWASSLNQLWKTLGRKMKAEMKQYPGRHSLIYVPNGFVVPGGRFNEIYYWDTYWVINGLLICGMYNTVKGILENMLYLVAQIGHFPNGNRIYYKERSQPPMLTLMVQLYYMASGDFQFITNYIHILDLEMSFWNRNRMVEIKLNENVYYMYRYHAVSSGPRPESYREDYSKAYKLNETEKLKFFIEIKSAAESGWDFSSRWFKSEANQHATLIDIHITRIIPVDLNAILEKCFRLLSSWYEMMGDYWKSNSYRDSALRLNKAIQDVLWHENDGIWYDFDLLTKVSRRNFYPSNFAPLWTNSYNFTTVYISQKILQYMKYMGLLNYEGGTPTSFDYTEEQWDFPNAWPPLQSFIILGLLNIGNIETSIVAFELAGRWLRTNYYGFTKFGKMFEKYNSLSIGETGAGGEYEAQDGFGWTNGFVLELLNIYGSHIESKSNLNISLSF